MKTKNLSVFFLILGGLFGFMGQILGNDILGGLNIALLTFLCVNLRLKLEDGDDDAE